MKALFPYYQQKGKMYKDLTAKELASVMGSNYIQSIKYDGNRIFITKFEDTIRCFTSDWKEFSFPNEGTDYDVLRELKSNKSNFVLEAEFNYGSVGKLGDRGKSAILTTFRTNFNKGINYVDSSFKHKVAIRIFDCLVESGGLLSTSTPYYERLVVAKNLVLPQVCEVISTRIVTGAHIIDITKRAVAEGWEGCMFVQCQSPYSMGLNSHKRTVNVIKNKLRPTVDILCIGVEPGTGKYTNMIGALVLRDRLGRTVSVGSGLTDDQRSMAPKFFIGQVVEISYEQIQDTYLQPVFHTVREDKAPMEID